MTATTYRVSFKRRKAAADNVPRVTRTAQLLALAYEIEDAIRRGEIDDLAEAARLAGVTRARMTQLVNLTLLPPPVQERVLDGCGSERQLRGALAQPLWTTLSAPRRASENQSLHGDETPATNPGAALPQSSASRAKRPQAR